MLTDFNRPRGSNPSQLSSGSEIDDAIKYVTPEMFKSKVVNGDWAPAIQAADDSCTTSNSILTGTGKTYPVGATVILRCGKIENINFTPKSGFTGRAVTAVVNQTTGLLTMKNIGVSGFINSGASITKGSYSGVPTFQGTNLKFNNNGSKVRTTIVNAINTATDLTATLVSVNGFSVGDYVWVADSKLRILSIDGNIITFYNDGTKPTTYSGGTGTGSYSAGQYFTKGVDGANGLTIGSGEDSWNISITGDNEFNNNGWFGLFIYANAVGNATKCRLDGVICNDNGYIGCGVGKAFSGVVSNGVFNRNSNNGFDINETTGRFVVRDCYAEENGVDGLFSTGVGLAPAFENNYCANNFRIGILMTSRSPNASGAVFRRNILTGNKWYGICLTGVLRAKITQNTFDGIARQHIRVEGRNGVTNPQWISITNNDFITTGTEYDIYGNVGGYTSGGPNGSIELVNNNYSTLKPNIYFINLSVGTSRFIPSYYVSYNDTLTATANSSISLSMTAFKAFSTAVIDNNANLATIQIYSNGNYQTTSNVDSSATRNAGIELSNNAKTSGKIILSFQFGTFTYSFVNTTAATRYLAIVINEQVYTCTLTWS